MMSAPGVFRPHWDAYAASISELGAEELARRWKTARQRIRENGVTYNVYGDPLGMDRPWNLDAIPILISPTEWRELEAGLIQRARLLNWILADLYGPQKLLRGGHLPPASRVRESRILAPVSRPPGAGQCLPASARGGSGAFRPTANGGCFPIACRRLPGPVMRWRTGSCMAETFPDLFREFQVQRLASFFRAFRNNLLQLSPSMNAAIRAWCC